jgi:hypothetical protein
MISFSIGFSIAWLDSYHFEFCNVNDIGVSTRVGLLMPVDSVKSGLATIANLPLETSAAQAPPEDV